MTQKKIDELIKNRKPGEILDLFSADLSGADLSHANLSHADLSCANLSHADLSGANLFSADLSGADLSVADLSHADLAWADLSVADLSHANLSHADLSCANLSGTSLDGKERYRSGVILDKKIIGYKKLENDIIATIEIPKGAVVFGINGEKFRTNKAKCIALSNNAEVGSSTYDNNFKYKAGKTYNIKDFDLMYNVECSTGIHFFKTKKEAEEY